MGKEASLIILGMINVLFLAGSCVAIALAVRKWLRGGRLVRFVPREDLDPGGVFTWIARAVARTRGEPTPSTQLRALRFWLDVRLGIWAFFIAFLPIILIHVYLQLFVVYQHSAITAIKSDPSLSVFLILALATVVQAPILEELVFRNFLQGFLEVYERLMLRRFRLSQRWIFGAIPIFLSSLTFAAMHWDQGAASVPLFLFALVLGYVYFQTHRLTPSIVAHAMLNLFTMLNLWFMR